MSTGTTVLTHDDVARARAAIGDRLHRTPTFTSASLAAQTAGRVFLKAELFQRTGSFKPRGVLNKLASLTAEEKRRGVISISAGNHAQALAYGAALQQVDALVVMWESASSTKIAATRAYGATVDASAPDIPAAFERLEQLVVETGRTLVHPFDEPLVIAGQGTVGLELVEDVPEVDVVIVPVGGGGLVSGIATAVKALRPQARVVAVEPELSAALHEGLGVGRPVSIEPRSAADGLNAPHAGGNCVELCSVLGVESVLVTEGELKAGLRFLYARAKLACELAGAAATAALLGGKVPLASGETAVAVVSGGNIAPENASAILAGL